MKNGAALAEKVKNMRIACKTDEQIVEEFIKSGVSQYRILKFVGANRQLVAKVTRRIRLYQNGQTSLNPWSLSVFEEGRKYVTTRWVALRIGLGMKYVSEAIRCIKAEGKFVSEISRRQETTPFHLVRLLAIDELWALFPQWRRRYDLRALEQSDIDVAERLRCSDLNDGQYLVFTALMEWWLRYQIWPTIKDLMSVETVRKYCTYSNCVKIIAQLIKKGYMTEERFGHWSTRYLVHKGPKRLVSQIAHCPKCQNVFREPWPFFQPKA